MGWLEILILVVIAGICGSIAQALSGAGSGGCLVSIVLGFIGALLGSWLAGKLGLPDILTIEVGGRNFPVIWSIIGGALFSAILVAVTRRRGL